MDLKEASILLVDDEPMLREIMCEWLRRVMGQVVCVEHGAEALQIMASRKIDLIISDVRMPVMDGIALLKKINEMHGHRPGVIFITGFSDLSLREALDLGAEAVLEKPIRREDLLNEAQRSLTELDELWQKPPVATAPEMKLKIDKLKIDFESLAAALQEKRIAFGRRGFCIETHSSLNTGPVDFTLDFKADRCVISGQGMVRWTAPQARQAGIEVMHLDDAGRAWMVHWTRQDQPIAFIPGSTGLVQTPKLETA
jgi:CheY-like chemotaxis protein